MEISNIILATLWFIGVLVWDLWSDYKKWEAKKLINHKIEWLIRGLLLSPTIYLLSHSIWGLITSTLLIGSIWWELFDGFYNKIRGFPWRFNGTIDPDDSILDRILQRLSPTQETILKWGLIATFTTLYLL